MSHGYLYKTVNLINKKIYIGQKKGEFNHNYYGSGLHIQRAIKKYGKSNFKVKVIAFVKTKKQADQLEKKFIAEYRKLKGLKKVYNITDGGQTGGTKGKRYSEKSRRKMSLNHQDFSGQNNPMFGRQQSKKQISAVKRFASKTKWMVYPLANKMKQVKLNLIPSYIRQGWVFGFIRKGVLT